MKIFSGTVLIPVFETTAKSVPIKFEGLEISSKFYGKKRHLLFSRENDNTYVFFD
jgi:hypothetical protein